MADIQACIPKGATDEEVLAMVDTLKEGYRQAVEVINGNSNWTAIEEENWFSPDIKKPDKLYGSIFDVYSSTYHASFPAGSFSPSYPFYDKKTGIPLASYGVDWLRANLTCPNDVSKRAVKAYKRFIERMSAITKSFSEKIGMADDPTKMVTSADIAAAAESKEGNEALVAKMEAIKAENEAKEKAIADQVVGDYPEIEFREQCFLLAKIFDIVAYKNITIEPSTVKILPYNAGAGNACLMVQGDPYAFMNKLTQYPTQQWLLDAKTHEISNLQPQIRLYKIMKDDAGEEYPVEFNFESHATKNDIEAMLGNSGKRGFGAGIKDFTFTYEGNNPFAVKKSISAKLTIFANTFDELMKDRGGFRYVDLALKTGGSKARAKLDKLNTQQADVRLENLSKLDFRLKAVVGWANPPNPAYTDRNFITAINNSFVTLNLTPTVHEFGFDDQGRVNFTCNYLAYVEDFFDQPAFSVFGDSAVEKNIYRRKFKYKVYNEVCESEAMAQFKKDNAPQIKKDKNAALTSIFTLLSKNDLLRYINIPWTELIKYKDQGPYWNMMEGSGTKEGLAIGKLADSQKVGLAASILESQKTPKEKEEETNYAKNAAWAANPLATAAYSWWSKEDPATEKEKIISKISKDAKTEQVVFFFLSDLVDAILSGMESKLMAYPTILDEIAAEPDSAEIPAEMLSEEKINLIRMHNNFKKLRVLLGPVEIVNPTDPSQSLQVNFGDIPISLRYFLDWLGEKTLKRAEALYPLPTFMNDLMNNLVRNFLNNDSCFGYSIKQKTRVNQASVTAYSTGEASETNLDTITHKILSQRMELEKQSINRLYFQRLDDGEYPILNICGIRDDPRAKPPMKDEYNYLVYYAARTQPVERMNGNYDEDVGNGIFHYMLGRDRGIIKNISLKRTDSPGLKEVRFEQEGFEGLNQLREVYDVDIDTFANVNAFPGVYIFVDPRGFAPNLNYEMKEEGFNVEDLSDYGLGGYYMIIRSTHSFGAGKANTKITAKWVNEIHKQLDAQDKKAVNDGKAPKDTPKKCGIIVRKKKEAEGGFLDGVMGSEITPEVPTDTGSKPPTE